ncbi:DUF3306 domain-containing protein [Mesorhizobium sp. LHD-90]|uniref:DUF3306 domain-containing protein n=1 Tax=Mesorhizobium sp. LHD-90 TaxID=3071414 RepID=UPI0027E2048A|nr:DUF3306 domain-containing protein [Mesorhizobium sp. LHD-90]MDQ6437678.1 DUF3306 domain-containing protein [Mesorhizobium sp. LHD-90]
MSAGRDNIFARWSRRKRAAQTSESQPPDDTETASLPPPAGAEETVAGERQEVAAPATAEAEAVGPGQPLPSLEDLTAESDLSAFLRKGVPGDLKSAALRTMWSLDPAIRDHVGLAEYAWDFNQPGAMAGFGPLDAKEAVVDFLSTIGRGPATDVEDPEASTQAPAQPPDPPEQASATPPDNASESASADASPARYNAAISQLDSPDPVPRPPGATRSSGEPRKKNPARPRHGGAMPR